MWYAEEGEGIQELLIGGVADDMGPVTQERTAVMTGVNDDEIAGLDEAAREHIAGEQHMGRTVAD